MAVACSPKGDPPAAPTVTELKSPAAPGSGEPNLSVGSEEELFLSWLEPEATDEYALRFSTRVDRGEWSTPQTIARGSDWFVSPADFPSLVALPDETLAASWFTATELETESYDINIAFSRDKGATWTAPISPHRDKKKRQHGFLSLVPFGGNQLAAVWLDGKNLPEDFIGDMALMHTTIAADGTLGPETQLDDRVCECCLTSMTATPDGLLVVYRDRSETEIRDISMVRYADGAWSQPEPLAKDGWEIYGCPVNGPAISSSDRNVAVAWFTAPNDQPRTSVLMSSDGGKTFGNPIRIDQGNPIGRVDVLSLPSGDAIVSWLERTESGARVRVRQIDPNGVAGAPVVVSEDGALSSGVTRLERSADGVVVAWADAEDKVRTTLINFGQ